MGDGTPDNNFFTAPWTSQRRPGEVSSVWNDVSGAAPGAWESVKSGASSFWHGMDKHPGATKLFSFGLAFIASGAIFSHIKEAVLRNRNASGLAQGFWGVAAWGLAFVVAAYASNALANKGASERAEIEKQQESDRRFKIEGLKRQADYSGIPPVVAPGGVTSQFGPAAGGQPPARVIVVEEPSPRPDIFVDVRGGFPGGRHPHPRGR